MKSAVDASVLWALLKDEPDAPGWRVTLEQAAREGDVVICAVAFAEVAPFYSSAAAVLEDLDLLSISYDPILPETAWRAGKVFKAYRQEGGPRATLIPDFLIGAHALVQADRLAAADRGYLRRYFPTLKLLAPK